MSLLTAYQTTRKSSEQMCHPLLTEDYIQQPVEFVSPPRWNLVHTSWFFEEFILKPYMESYRQMHPLYNHLFNSYYEGAGERTARHGRKSYRNFFHPHLGWQYTGIRLAKHSL